VYKKTERKSYHSYVSEGDFGWKSGGTIRAFVTRCCFVLINNITIPLSMFGSCLLPIEKCI